MNRYLIVLLWFIFGCNLKNETENNEEKGVLYSEVIEIKQQKVVLCAGIIRYLPSKESNIISKLELGEVITTIARTLEKDSLEIGKITVDSYWYKVSNKGNMGWIFGGYLSDKFATIDRGTIEKGIIKIGQIWTFNDTLINCKINQINKETEIYIDNISFINSEVAILHSLSSAGHIDETIAKVKYKIEDNLLKLYFTDKSLSRNTLGEITEWKVEENVAAYSEFELEKCNEKNIFRKVGLNYYGGKDTELEYQESYEDIDSLINVPIVKKLLNEIK